MKKTESLIFCLAALLIAVRLTAPVRLTGNLINRKTGQSEPVVL